MADMNKIYNDLIIINLYRRMIFLPLGQYKE